jgi:hypothetical protein
MQPFSNGYTRIYGIPLLQWLDILSTTPMGTPQHAHSSTPDPSQRAAQPSSINVCVAPCPPTVADIERLIRPVSS